MTLSRQRTWIINISSSTALLFLLIFFSYDILESLHNFLNSIHRPLAGSSFSPLDAIVIGLIPIWSYFLYFQQTAILVRHILLANLATIVSTVIMSVLVFIVCATFIKHDSPWLPDYIVITPFLNFFWTIVFIIGVTVPHLINKILRGRQSRTGDSNSRIDSVTKLTSQELKTDKILEIGIDEQKRLYIKPETERFTLIYRTATEVHWDNKELFLYSPKPRDWTYFDWFKHITSVTETECNCKLILTDQTKWTNIPNELKEQIVVRFSV